MGYLRHKLLTLALIAGYGGISVLGYGLHWLAPGHEHHHGLHLVCSEDGGPHHRGHRHHHHHGCSHDAERPLGVSALQFAGHSHLCEICVYLSQARAEIPKLVRVERAQLLVTWELTWPQRSCAAISLGPHSPRGPPQHAA